MDSPAPTDPIQDPIEIPPNTTSSPVPLPYDLLSLISLSILSFPPIPRTRTLLSLSLVSHEFLQIAQPLLYTSPYISFDPPDTTPPGTTYSRLLSLVRTLERRRDLAERVRGLGGLGGWGKRCLSEGIPERRKISKIMIRLCGLCQRVEKVDVPFIVEADKGDLMRVFKTWREVEEVRYGTGYEVRDPWIVNVDQRVMDEWGSAKWYIEDFGELSNQEWRGVKRFELNQRLRIRDEEGEKLGFELEEFSLNLTKNSKLSFAYLSNYLSSSISTLTSLSLREHQLSSPSTLFQVVRTCGQTLKILETTSSNQFDSNLDLVHCISASCPSLLHLSLGSRVDHLFPTLSLLSFLPSLQTLHLKSVHSLEIEKERLEDVIFGFPRLRILECEPIHANVEDGLKQEREVAKEFRKLEGKVRGRRRVRSKVRFWKWRVEIEGV